MIELTDEEAAKRLKAEGPNTFFHPKKSSLLRLFLDQFKSPLIVLLLVAAIITYFFGRKSDPLVVLAVALLNALIGGAQEFQASRSLFSLKKMTQPLSRVIRSGKERLISSEEIVRGDHILLEAGEVVPADCRVLFSQSGEVNEAQITGESISVVKAEENPLFAGSFVTKGSLRALVITTGSATEVGKLVQITEQAKKEKAPLEKKIEVFTRHVAWGALTLAGALLFVGWLRGIPFAELLLASVSELVSVIPEGLPVAITVALSVAVQRMAREKAIIRKLSAAQTLGCTSVIACDKTGTLTRGEMEVKEVISSDPVSLLKSCLAGIDPMDKALAARALKEGIEPEEKIGEIPFNPETKVIITIHPQRRVMRGAPETVFYQCALSNGERDALFSQVEERMREGFRVIAFAEGEKYLGFVTLYDPPRVGVKEAIEECRRAGIRPVMITGDHLLTAKSIAKEIGLIREGELAIVGAELEKMGEKELEEKLDQIAVFARVLPLQKHKIIVAFKAKGEVLAMTGDGVNDAPAIAEADIGIAMGSSGTEIAKEAAKLVILDDNFSTIVKAVLWGRVLYRNIQKIIHYLLSTSFALVVLLFLSLVFGYPLPLSAVQILWLNVVTEGVVTITLILDPPEGDEMNLPPVSQKEPLLAWPQVQKSLLVMALMAGVLLTYYFYEINRGKPLPEVQSEVFTLFAFMAWFKLLSARSETKSAFSSLFSNKLLLLGLTLALALQASVLYLPPLRDLFGVTPLPGRTLALLLLLALPILLLDEVLKAFRRSANKV